VAPPKASGQRWFVFSLFKNLNPGPATISFASGVWPLRNFIRVAVFFLCGFYRGFSRLPRFLEFAEKNLEKSPKLSNSGHFLPRKTSLFQSRQVFLGAVAVPQGKQLKGGFAPTYPFWAAGCLGAGALGSVKRTADLWQGNTLLGITFILGTAFCWGISTAIGRRALLEIPPLPASAARIVVGTLCMWALCVVQGTPPSLADLQEIVASEQPMIFLASPNVVVARANSVGNFRPAVLDHQTLWNAEDLFLSKDGPAK